MLVLSRQKNQEVMIGKEITITIVSIGGNRVKLGITAPKDVPVHRREVFEKIQRKKDLS